MTTRTFSVHGDTHPSMRGFYIVGRLDNISMGSYLYHDGQVRGTVRASESGAFWTTREEAETFLASWLEENHENTEG